MAPEARVKRVRGRTPEVCDIRRRAGAQGKDCDTWRMVWLFVARVVWCMACDLLVLMDWGCARSGLGGSTMRTESCQSFFWSLQELYQCSWPSCLREVGSTWSQGENWHPWWSHSRCPEDLSVHVGICCGWSGRSSKSLLKVILGTMILTTLDIEGCIPPWMHPWYICLLLGDDTNYQIKPKRKTGTFTSWCSGTSHSCGKFTLPCVFGDCG